MTFGRHVWVLVGVAVVSPVLILPRGLGAEHAWIAVIVAVAALGAAVGLSRDSRRLALGVAMLALAALIGWSRSAHQIETVDHFAGLALGLLVMAALFRVCRTRRMLVVATTTMLVFGLGALGVGLRSATPIHGAKALSSNPLADPERPAPLPLATLHDRRQVNPNPLGAAAMMILPIAAAVALVPVRGMPAAGILRVLGGLAALAGGLVVLLTQSRSVWLSALVVGGLLLRRWLPSRTWWILAGTVGVLGPLTLVALRPEHALVVEAMGVVQGRVDLWRDGGRALWPTPWFGIGLDYLRYSGLALVQVAPDKIAGAPHAHNILLQVALDVGLFGLVWYLAIMGGVLRRSALFAGVQGADPWVRSVSTGAALSLVSVHVFGVLDAIPLGTKVGLLQWWSCGLILAARRIQSSSDSPRVGGA